MPDGVCPFATPIGGGIDRVPNGGPMWDIVGICDHAAGGFYSTLMDSGFWHNTTTSVNFAIARDGRIGQILNLFTGPYGQGRDQDGRSIDANSRGISWPHWAQMGKRNPNGYLVATEHEDYELVGGVARAVPGSEWTPAEYSSDLRLKRWMIEETKRVKNKDLLRFGIGSLASHYMFDPVNRVHCAGTFWRNDYRQRLYTELTENYDMFTVHSAGKLTNEIAPIDYVYDLKRLGFPVGIKRIRLQVWPSNDPIEFYHGLPDANNRDAGRAYPPYGIIEVIPNAEGFCYVGPPGATFDISPLGFYN